MREFARSFYKSKAWQDCRASFIKSKGGLCERCKAKGLIVAGTEVHHKRYLTPDNINDTSITLNYNNLELLCPTCHQHEHHRSQRRYKVDKYGRVTINNAPHSVNK